MEKQLIKKYGKRKLIQILKELQPHLNRKQQELNRGYLRKMQFGAAPVAAPYAANLNTIFAIDTCHDFRDRGLSSFVNGISHPLNNNIRTLLAGQVVGDGEHPPYGSLLQYLISLDQNDEFIQALDTTPNTEPNNRNSFNYDVSGNFIRDAERITRAKQRYARLSEDIKTADGYAFFDASGGHKKDNYITLFGIHDPNSSNGKIMDIITPKKRKLLSNQTNGHILRQAELIQGEFNLPHGIASVIRGVGLRLELNNRTVTATYQGDNDNLFFAECKIHSKDEFNDINNDILLPLMKTFTALCWRGIKISSISSKLKITEQNGNLTLHCKGVGPPAPHLLSLMVIFCCLRGCNHNYRPTNNVVLVPIINKCRINDNAIFLARMKSIFDIKRLGDHGQNLYALKIARTTHAPPTVGGSGDTPAPSTVLASLDPAAAEVLFGMESESLVRIVTHQTGDFWAGIHFGLVKRHLQQNLDATAWLNTVNTLYKQSLSPPQPVPPQQPTGMFFGSQTTPPQARLAGPGPTEGSRTRGAVIRRYTVTVMSPHFQIIEGDISSGYDVDGDTFQVQSTEDPETIKKSVLYVYNNEVAESYENGAHADWNDKPDGYSVTDLSGTVSGEAIYNVYNEFNTTPFYDDETMYIYPGELLQNPGDNTPSIDSTSENIADTYVIFKVTRQAAGAMLTFSPEASQSSQSFGKKQKRWVADLTGKKKFVRRQVYSTRKDLVTPAYFEKMTGANFWKLPVAK